MSTASFPKPTPAAVMRGLVDRVKQGQSVAAFREEFADVIRSGAGAYYSDTPATRNPYPDGSLEADCWASGWHAASREDE